MTVTTTLPLPGTLPHAVPIPPAPWHSRSIRDLHIPAISKCLLERRGATTFGAVAVLIDRDESLGLDPALEDTVKKQVAKAREEQPEATEQAAPAAAAVPVADVLPVAAPAAPVPITELTVAGRKASKSLRWVRNEFDHVKIVSHKSFVVVCALVIEDWAKEMPPFYVLRVWIWTPKDLAAWWAKAMRISAITGCDIDEAMRNTMPESRAELDHTNAADAATTEATGGG